MKEYKNVQKDQAHKEPTKTGAPTKLNVPIE